MPDVPGGPAPDVPGDPAPDVAGQPALDRRAAALRTALVDALSASGAVRTAAVAAAMRAVPRHLFLPGVSVDAAYADEAVVTRRDAAGTPVSSASQPSIVAIMLEQLAVRPGHRVLEIGAGTGYNAALLGRLAGPLGAVTTVDIDADVAAGARAGLSAARDADPGAGTAPIQVVHADGTLGHAPGAPYDRIIVTAGADDLFPAWLAQLTGDGRIVVPLDIRGTSRSIAFDSHGDHLIGRSAQQCGFIPMRGAGTSPEAIVRLHGDDVVLRLDPHWPAGTGGPEGSLDGVLDLPPAEIWTGVTGTAGPLPHLDLWLTATVAGICRLTATGDAATSGLARPVPPFGAPAVAHAGSLAYLTARQITEPPAAGPGGTGPPATPPAAGPGGTPAGRRRFEYGSRGHGPDGLRLAALIADQVRAFDRDHRSRPEPTIEAYPAGTADARLAGRYVVDKPHTRLAFGWPAG